MRLTRSDRLLSFLSFPRLKVPFFCLDSFILYAVLSHYNLVFPLVTYYFLFSIFGLHFLSLSFLLSLLVVGGAPLPLPSVVHARRADGAGDEVGGARGHEVSHCRRDVHPLVCHQVICAHHTHK